MGMRVAFLAAECEPWAKTGGLADVVDALARALGRIGDDAIDGPVDVFLPRYRTVPEPEASAFLGSMSLAVPDRRAIAGTSTLTIVDVAANRYRLRLVDHPPAFDRAELYGDAAGGSGCTHERHSRPCARKADPSTSFISTTGRPGPQRSSAIAGTRTTRSSDVQRS
jgi:starch synthase